MSRPIEARLKRVKGRMSPSARGLVVIQVSADDPESEEAAIAEAKASGLASEGDGFIVIRRFSHTWQEGFTPYRIGDVGAMLRHVAKHGRKIFPGPNCHAG